MNSGLKFQVEKNCIHSRARLGSLTLRGRKIQTPIFMPVGTHGSIRGTRIDEVKSIGYELILSNTYHLMVRPGLEFFKKRGGLHRFMNWDAGILTDSGGFQIFCMPTDRAIKEEGAKFRSYYDGTLLALSPELSVQMQQAIGSDIMMVLDHCVPSTVPYAEAKDAMERTHRWAIRSLAERGSDRAQALFGIVQGACFPDLRKQSADFLSQHDFDGLAVGGLAVGETYNQRCDATEIATEFLPKDRPRYLMGVGKPEDLLEAIYRGIDMFDCILPNALAQQGVAFTWAGKKDLRKSKYKSAEEMLDPECSCATCATYSVDYLHHLIKVYDPLAWQAIGYHNLFLYHDLMQRIRDAIRNDTFENLYRNLISRWVGVSRDDSKSDQEKSHVSI